MTEPGHRLPSEDSRRPGAVVPYAALWVITLLCGIFALIAILSQG